MLEVLKTRCQVLRLGDLQNSGVAAECFSQAARGEGSRPLDYVNALDAFVLCPG